MTEQVEALLRDLQGAVSASHLYSRNHPRVIELLERIVANASAVFATRPEVAVFWMDGRLVFDGAPLPGGDALARGLFGAMREHGFHRLVIRRGLSTGEVAAFVSAAAGAGRTGDGFRSSAHISLSAYDGVEGAASTPAIVAPGPEQFDTLTRVWAGVAERRQLDLDGLEFTMLALARTVDQSIGAVLPLATMKSHDDYTVTHIVNVALLSMALAEAVGLAPAVVKDVGISALLHDVGKLRVPAEVLNATGRLTEGQRAMIRRHPEDGARILLTTPGVPDLAVTVAYEHHLQFDGGGYPTVPRGWKMNLASEITHIADVFDALRTNRPYRPALRTERIVGLMAQDAGTVFDPHLVSAFFDVVAPRTSEEPAAEEGSTAG